MEVNSSVLLTTAYLPPVDWFRAAARYGQVQIEGCETFQKQSYRNRCVICTASGPQTLQLPILHAGSRLIRDIRIDYSKNWLHTHCHAISTAYGPSPFYEYYWDGIAEILAKRHTFLFDLNYELAARIAAMMNLRTEFSITGDWGAAAQGVTDLREAIHPKREPAGSPFKEYFQVFAGRMAFIPNLSIIDLLFCEGPQATSYL
ncbi:MAG: WbqC family protein [Bacteroidales bacterium]|nr:WbqC family protein [Bacteroidales bacterium]